jgi:hypothetical protein
MYSVRNCLWILSSGTSVRFKQSYAIPLKYLRFHFNSAKLYIFHPRVSTVISVTQYTIFPWMQRERLKLKSETHFLFLCWIPILGSIDFLYLSSCRWADDSGMCCFYRASKVPLRIDWSIKHFCPAHFARSDTLLTLVRLTGKDRAVWPKQFVSFVPWKIVPWKICTLENSEF